MKKCFLCIYVELKKVINSVSFVLCVFLTFLICFTSTIYIDVFSGKEYTVFEMLLNKNKFNFDDFYCLDVLHYSISPYVTLFLPTLSSIPFISSYCTERTSNNIRFTIIRQGKIIYYISKFVSASLSAALTVMIGFIIYSIVLTVTFNNSNILFLDYIKLYIGMGIYGWISLFPAFFLSSFIKNKYVLYCFPFIIIHFYYTIISKIQDYFSSINKINLVIKMEFLYPNRLKEVLFVYDKNMIVYNIVLIIITVIAFVIIMNRRADYGE